MGRHLLEAVMLAPFTSATGTRSDPVDPQEGSTNAASAGISKMAGRQAILAEALSPGSLIPKVGHRRLFLSFGMGF